MRRTPPRLLRAAVAAAALAVSCWAQAHAPAAPQGLERYAARDSSNQLIEDWLSRCAPHGSVRHMMRGEESFKAGKYEEAVAHFEKAVEEKPDGRLAYYFLAVAYETVGRYKDAVASYKKVLTHDDSSGLNLVIITHYNLANVYAALGRAKEAVAENEQVVKLLPDEPHGQYNLGLSYAATGQMDKARAAFSRAAEIKPDYPEAHYNLAVAHLAVGDRASAETRAGALEPLAPALAARLKEFLR